MAGHSQFKNIMHRKGAQDTKRAKIFTKLDPRDHRRGQAPACPTRPPIRACAPPSSRPRQANMPKDTDRARDQARRRRRRRELRGGALRGLRPGGIAVIVEALTDNRNRTAAEVRSAFAKHGGALGETG